MQGDIREMQGDVGEMQGRSMRSILCGEERTASSKPARSAPSAGCCTSCFQKTEQSEREMTVSFWSSAIAMKTPIISYLVRVRVRVRVRGRFRVRVRVMGQGQGWGDS